MENSPLGCKGLLAEKKDMETLFIFDMHLVDDSLFNLARAMEKTQLEH